MGMANQHTMDAIEAFQKAQNQDDLWQLFHESMETFGIKEVTYGYDGLAALNFESFLENAFIRTSLPQEYISDKENDQHLENDYYWQEFSISSDPLLWSEQGFRETLDTKQLASLDIDWDHNIITGITLPTYFGEGLGIGGIGLHAKGMSWEEFDRIWAYKADDIQSIFTAFDICMREDHIQEAYPLSFREKECLLWLASGLRPQQIADRFHVHTKTVEKQIASARRKLKADTVPQAIAKSLIYGLITP